MVQGEGLFRPRARQQTDQEIANAGWAGASQAAAQTASDWRACPVQVLTNALAGYNTARYRAQEGLREREREDRILALKERGLEAEIGESEAKAAQRQQIMGEIAKIEDPLARQAAMMNPEAFAAQMSERLFAGPEKLMEVDGGIFDPN